MNRWLQRIALLLILAALCPEAADAQPHARRQLDQKTGLPDNRVYMSLEDDHGYLWLCTPKGVVRYNGYEVKKFDVSSGLPTSDIWGIQNDLKNRIWLYYFGEDIGYIADERVTRIPMPDDKAVMPGSITPYRDGVLLANEGVHLAGKNNIRRLMPVSKWSRTYIDKRHRVAVMDIESNRLERLRLLRTEWDSLVLVKSCPGEGLDPHSGAFSTLMFYDYLLSFEAMHTQVYVLDIHGCRNWPLDLNEAGKRPQYVYYGYTDENNLYILTTDYINVLDSTLRITQRIPIASLAGGLEGKDLSHYYRSALWGTCLSTHEAGLQMIEPGANHFRPFRNTNLDGFRMISDPGDSVAFWWNPVLKKLTRIYRDGRVASIGTPRFHNFRKSLPYDQSRSLVIERELYWLDHDLEHITSVYDKTHPVSRATGYNNGVRVGQGQYIFNSLGLLTHIYLSEDSIKMTEIDDSKYDAVAWDHYRELAYLYAADRLFIAGKGKPVMIEKEQLRAAGFSNLRQILTDPVYGNCFVLDREKLVAVYPGSPLRQALLQGFNLSDARLMMHDGKLVAAGAFGVLILPVKGALQFGTAVHLPNYKKENFGLVYHIQPLDKDLLLQTDKGSFLMSWLAADSTRHPSGITGSSYRLIARHGDVTERLGLNDTLVMGQNIRFVSFDVIHPLGDGRPRYYYRLKGSNGTWQELSGNDLNLQQLKAGIFHNIELRFQDESWKSNVYTLHCYITPYWWQTKSGRIVIWLCVLLFLLVSASAATLITRSIIARKNKARQQQLELELKSLYSQINPHFIFNTLNSAMSLIRKKDTDLAYEHVFKFSNLLRSYLRSSRNRYISIEEEADNLRNYIGLQQVRFNHAFSYEIEIGEGIHPVTTKIPSLLLQPLVENAINHGLVPKDAPGHLRISFSRGNMEAEEVVIAIEDDGIGRERSRELREGDTLLRHKESFGSTLIRELVNLFNKYEPTWIDLEYTDKAFPLTGTIVRISIKKRPEHES